MTDQQRTNHPWGTDTVDKLDHVLLNDRPTSSEIHVAPGRKWGGHLGESYALCVDCVVALDGLAAGTIARALNTSVASGGGE